TLADANSTVLVDDNTVTGATTYGIYIDPNGINAPLLSA
ncbi:unnamed protein product, partial [marine sediment metagenome]